jgi:hypothetical protein
MFITSLILPLWYRLHTNKEGGLSQKSQEEFSPIYILSGHLEPRKYHVSNEYGTENQPIMWCEARLNTFIEE